AVMFTCPTPPGTWPTRELAKLKIRSVIPDEFIRFPVIIKNGIASNVKLLIPLINCPPEAIVKFHSPVRKYINAAIVKVNPTGIPKVGNRPQTVHLTNISSHSASDVVLLSLRQYLIPRSIIR